MVGVAQSAERLVVVQEVAGSTPVAHPMHEVRTSIGVPVGVRTSFSLAGRIRHDLNRAPPTGASGPTTATAAAIPATPTAGARHPNAQWSKNSLAREYLF